MPDAVSASLSSCSLPEYFHRCLSSTARQLRRPPRDETLWYLSQMLARFGRSDALLSYDRGQVSIRPLALLYGDALACPDERQRCNVLRQMGDMALFLGALFPERYARHGIYRDYFIGMGGGAYDYLASNARQSESVFDELARRFGAFLDLIAQSCRRDPEGDARDILALYRRWLHNGDPLAEKQLRALGVALVPGPKAH